MDSSSVAMVPSATVVLPTLGRESLARAMTSLEAQTDKPLIIVKNGQDDTLIKLKEGVNEATTEFVAVADDDAEYPKDWLSHLSEAMTEKTGFVGGPCLALLDADSSDAEKRIAKVSSSYFGTSNMSYRAKVKGKVRDADETNLIGNGLYRREVFAKILNEEYDKIPPASWETYIFIRIKQLGFRTVLNPQGFFYHKQRTNLLSFAKQIFRSGTGRMTFFKHFPSQIPTKIYILFPMFFAVYLLAFFLLNWFNIAVVSGIPLILYVLVNLLVSWFQKDLKLSYYYFVMHISYGFGELFGLIRSMRRWT